MWNKRGGEAIGLSMKWIINLIIMAILLTSIIVFITTSGSNANKNEIIAKELCVFVNMASENTKITIGPDKNLIIERKDDGFLIRKEKKDIGFFYSCYLTDRISVDKVDTYYIIEVKNE